MEKINPKKEILELADGEEIEAIELHVETGGKNKQGGMILVPKMFKGNKVLKALSLMDHDVEDEWGGCGVYVTAWTKSYVVSAIHHQDSQTCWNREYRNPPD